MLTQSHQGFFFRELVMKKYSSSTAFVFVVLSMASWAQGPGAGDFFFKTIPVTPEKLSLTTPTEADAFGFSKKVSNSTAYCRSPYDFNSYTEVPRQAGQTDDEACAMSGLKDTLTLVEIQAIKAQENKDQLLGWLQNEPPQGDFCYLDLTPEQRKMIQSITAIKGKINCQKYTSMDSKLPRKQKGKTLDEVSVSEKLEACSCLANETPPLKLSEEFVVKYNEQVKAFIHKEYIANLYNARLYQYSLGGDVLASDDISFCVGLAKNTDLQNKAKAKDEERRRALNKDKVDASYITQLVSPLGTKEATELYSINKQKKTPPIVSKAAFEKFVTDWGMMTHPKSFMNQNKNANEIIRDAMDTLQSMHSEQQDFKVKTKHLSEMADATKANKGEDLSEQIIYLEKLLTAKFDQSDKTLLSQVVDKLKNDKSGNTDQAFASAFKEITSSYMNSQCASNSMILDAILSDDYSSINFDPKLVGYLAKNMPNEKMQMEKFHCAILQKAFETDPESFLFQVCEFDGEKLPPPLCPAIGDFYRGGYVERGNLVLDSNSTNAKGKSNFTSKGLDGVLDDSALKSVISDQVKIVRSEHGSTFSSFVSEASKKSSNYSKNSFLDVKMSDLAPEKITTYTTTARHQRDDFNHEARQQAQAEEMIARNNQIPGNLMQNFQKEVLPILPSASSSPVMRIESHAVAISTPVPMTTPIVIQTPAPKKVEQVSGWDDEESLMEKVKLQKKKRKKKKIADEETEYVEEESAHSPQTDASSMASGGNSNNNISFGSNSSRPSPAVSAAPVAAPVRSVNAVSDDAARQFVEARHFEKDIVFPKDGYDTTRSAGGSYGMVDSAPPETGVMLSAFRTGKISGKDITRIALGDDIKDVKSFEQTNTYHGPVVIVEDKAKNQRYICRAFVTDSKDGVDRLLPLEAQAPGKDELGGYKCTTDKVAADLKAVAAVAEAEKAEAKKAIVANDRLYKAFVLDKIMKQTQPKKERKIQAKQ